MKTSRTRQSPRRWSAVNPARAVLALAIFLGGTYVAASSYANPRKLENTPLVTTRGDVAVALLDLRLAAAAAQQKMVQQQKAPAASEVRALRARAAHLLSMDPMSSDALVLAEANVLDPASRNRGRALAGEALRRDPRSRAAWAWRTVDSASERRFTQAFASFERLVEVSPADADEMLPLMVLLANDPGARQAMLRLLDTPRPWHARFAGLLPAARLPLPILLQFGERLARHPDAATKQAVYSALIDRGAYSDAHRLWRANSTQSHGRNLINDPTFAADGSSFPFGWTFQQEGPDGSVQRDGGGLEVRYSGAVSMSIASQMVVLAPGSYELVVTGADAGLRADFLSWTVRCRPQDAVLADVKLDSLAAGARALRHRFTVPANCPAQIVSLVGGSAMFPVDQTLMIRSVAITPMASISAATN